MSFFQVNNVCIKSISNTKHVLSVSPLPKGFGHTLGYAFSNFMTHGLTTQTILEVSFSSDMELQDDTALDSTDHKLQYFYAMFYDMYVDSSKLTNSDINIHLKKDQNLSLKDMCIHHLYDVQQKGSESLIIDKLQLEYLDIKILIGTREGIYRNKQGHDICCSTVKYVNYSIEECRVGDSIEHDKLEIRFETLPVVKDVKKEVIHPMLDYLKHIRM